MKLLKFYADWCQPCKMLTKTLEDIELPFPVVQIDIDADMDTAITYGVRGVPTMILVDDNNAEVKRASGYMNEAQFKKTFGLE